MIKMRHQGQLEVSAPIGVDEKVVFLNTIKVDQALVITDVVSEAGDSLVSMYFSTEDGDEGRIQVYDNIINIFVGLGFTRLINLYNFTATYFTDTLVDLVATYGKTEPEPEPEPPVLPEA